jgi:ATP/maltotriose-dependent transcriptional regulator MalT
VPLSTREREIAAPIAGGLSNREIAERFTVSARTVQGHMQCVHQAGRLRQ